jgi:hypothetical protein
MTPELSRSMATIQIRQIPEDSDELIRQQARSDIV